MASSSQVPSSTQVPSHGASSPQTVSSSTPAKIYYKDPKILYERVGCFVKPTNPLLKFIPECKNIDEFNEWTKTETYRKLMDFRNPIMEPKMDPKFKKTFNSVVEKRKMLADISDYPIYAKIPKHRFWYRLSWTVTIIGTLYASYNGLWIVKNF